MWKGFLSSTLTPHFSPGQQGCSRPSALPLGLFSLTFCPSLLPFHLHGRQERRERERKREREQAREESELAAATPRGSLDNLRNVISLRLDFPTSQQGPSFLPRAQKSFQERGLGWGECRKRLKGRDTVVPGWSKASFQTLQLVQQGVGVGVGRGEEANCLNSPLSEPQGSKIRFPTVFLLPEDVLKSRLSSGK